MTQKKKISLKSKFLIATIVFFIAAIIAEGVLGNFFWWSITIVSIIITVLLFNKDSRNSKNINQEVRTNTNNRNKTINNTNIANRNTHIRKPIQGLYIHPDLEGLIWLLDGPNKNYSPKPSYSNETFQGFNINFTTVLGDEPSALSLSLPVSLVRDNNSVERPPYYPRYSELTPEQRGVYFNLLKNPYQNINIGFVFILYYGLERHLLEGDFDRAFDVILKLRDFHSNKSFQDYSSSALILMAILKGREDKLWEFYNSLDKDYEKIIQGNIFMLIKTFFKEGLRSDELFSFAKYFSFTNTRYIKSEPELFKEEIQNIISNTFRSNNIPLEEYRRKTIKSSPVNVFANISIENKCIDIPDLFTVPEFVQAGNAILNQAHNQVKGILADKRKNSSTSTLKTNNVDFSKHKVPVDKSVDIENLSNIGYSIDMNQIITDRGSDLQFYLNRENSNKAIKDIMSLNRFIKEGIALNVGISNTFFEERNIVFDKSKNDYSFISISKLTPSGKIPRYPLKLYFNTLKNRNDLSANWLFGTIEYLIDGNIGKAIMHLWVNGKRRSISLAIMNKVLLINSVTTSDDKGSNIILYDYKPK